MTNSGQSLFTKMYENMQAQNGGQAGPDMGGFAGGAGQDMGGAASAGSDDDVIDGDFREV